MSRNRKTVTESQKVRKTKVRQKGTQREDKTNEWNTKNEDEGKQKETGMRKLSRGRLAGEGKEIISSGRDKVR